MNQTLEEFIACAEKKIYPSSEYVEEPGFEHLYVRFGKTYIEGQWYQRILTIANVQAEEPGQGTFTKFIQRIKQDWPDVGIYVECVLNPRFAAWLVRNGFSTVTLTGQSFYWLVEGNK